LGFGRTAHRREYGKRHKLEGGEGSIFLRDFWT
jgi:hypothetical protein